VYVGLGLGDGEVVGCCSTTGAVTFFFALKTIPTMMMRAMVTNIITELGLYFIHRY